MTTHNKTLDHYRDEFKQKKLMATPLAGTLVWLVLGIAALFFPPEQMIIPFYIGLGSIYYIAIGIGKLTGEDLLLPKEKRNPFDTLFLSTMIMSLLVFAIAIPFMQENFLAQPMALGILSGLMWFPLSWIIQHPVGIYHAVSRTLTLVVIWYVAPEHSFTLVPFAIVIIYAFSLVSLYKRWQKENSTLVGKPAEIR
ncbi:DUF7010 family protein [Thalassotalea euphylliae]|uniref:DUF7010 family protein n=1 Tax=Thalassotalea euphylliae TaxID=1655234 RepID=UPI003627CE7D